MTRSPHEVALEVVTSMPEDATLEDLQEFLWEREMVERGRADAALQALGVPEEVPSDPASQVPWAQAAIDDFRDTVRKWTSRDNSADLWQAVARAIGVIVADPDRGASLPEMGDPGILEVVARHGLAALRVVYELNERVPRVLWVTSNTTCYRNVRPRSEQSRSAG